MAALARLVAIQVGVLVLVPATALAADDEKKTEEKTEDDSEGPPAKKPEPKPEGTPPPAEARVRGPAEDLVVEGSFGYGVGPFTTIAAHKPRVVHGPIFHLAIGWAWTIRSNQSLGLSVTADGMFDGEKTTTNTEAGLSGNGAIGGRYGASAWVIGEKAHVKVGGGWASSTYQGANYQGLSLNFTAGWHAMMLPAATQSWKRPAVTFDFATGWDFLGAGDETLHRWTVGLLLGFAMY
jgi:hypothetical protein